MTNYIVTITKSAQQKSQVRSNKIKVCAPTLEDVLINVALLYGFLQEDIVSILPEEE